MSELVFLFAAAHMYNLCSHTYSVRLFAERGDAG